ERIFSLGDISRVRQTRRHQRKGRNRTRPDDCGQRYDLTTADHLNDRPSGFHYVVERQTAGNRQWTVSSRSRVKSPCIRERLAGRPFVIVSLPCTSPTPRLWFPATRSSGLGRRPTETQIRSTARKSSSCLRTNQDPRRAAMSADSSF